MCRRQHPPRSIASEHDHDTDPDQPHRRSRKLPRKLEGTSPGAPLDVIGAGQAGLALAWHLNRRGARYSSSTPHRRSGSWRTRWDSLRLFTPAQYDSLAGTPFAAEFDTHPTKDPGRRSCRWMCRTGG